MTRLSIFQRLFGGRPEAPEPAGPPPTGTGSAELAMVLSGGGARAAYQVGVLRGLGRLMPDARFPIITGVSAGAINAAFLAAHPGPLEDAAEAMYDLWSGLEIERVFAVQTWPLLANAARWALRLGLGGSGLAPRVRGLVDTAPLRRLLLEILDAGGNPAGEVEGIARNIESGQLKATALTTIDYGTGQTVTWVEGADFETWERPNRQAREVRLTVDHVLASAALPLLFPAVHLEGAWHGDGGIRLAAPLSPAIHLGASRMLVVSTRYRRSRAEESASDLVAYPPPAQILGKLLNAVFLDLVDQDVARLERINELIEKVPAAERGGFRRIESLVIRPSEDLGRLSSRFEPKLPWAFRFFTRGLGTRETKSPDFLSMLMFEPAYLQRLIAIGERDAAAHAEQLKRLIAP